MTAAPSSRQRAAAAIALALALATAILTVVVTVEQWPRALIVLGCLGIGMAAGWYGLLRRGAARLLGGAIALCALAALVILLIVDLDHPAVAILIPVGLAAASASAKAAFRVHVPLPAAPPPSHPVLLYNPKSGGGKAERFSLDDEARSRGITPIELTPGADLERLARDAVAAGPTRWRRQGGTAHRRSWPRSPRSSTCPTPACRREPETTSRSTSASIAMTSSAPSMRSSTAASDGSTWPR